VARQSAVSKNRLGTVIWFDPKACCGFIKPDEGGPDIFARILHKKGMAMTLAAGNRVSYELVPSSKLVETEAFILAKVI
jgi:cold shock CspA family protein